MLQKKIQHFEIVLYLQIRLSPIDMRLESIRPKIFITNSNTFEHVYACVISMWKPTPPPHPLVPSPLRIVFVANHLAYSTAWVCILWMMLYITASWSVCIWKLIEAAILCWCKHIIFWIIYTTSDASRAAVSSLNTIIITCVSRPSSGQMICAKGCCTTSAAYGFIAESILSFLWGRGACEGFSSICVCLLMYYLFEY